MDKLTEGIYHDVAMPDYVADPCVEPSASKGTLHDLLTKSPMHARYNHPRLNPDRPAEDSTRSDLGSAIHAAILDDDRVDYGDFPNYMTKAAKSWREGVRLTGGIPMLDKDKKAVMGAVGPAKSLWRMRPLG